MCVFEKECERKVIEREINCEYCEMFVSVKESQREDGKRKEKRREIGVCLFIYV